MHHSQSTSVDDDTPNGTPPSKSPPTSTCLVAPPAPYLETKSGMPHESESAIVGASAYCSRLRLLPTAATTRLHPYNLSKRRLAALYQTTQVTVPSGHWHLITILAMNHARRVQACYVVTSWPPHAALMSCTMRWAMCSTQPVSSCHSGLQTMWCRLPRGWGRPCTAATVFALARISQAWTSSALVHGTGDAI